MRKFIEEREKRKKREKDDDKKNIEVYVLLHFKNFIS